MKKMIFFISRPLILILLIPYILLLLTPFQFRIWFPFGVLGALLSIVGAVLFIISHWLVYRPDQWSSEQPLFGEPKRLVTTGPYRHIRNPNLLGIYFMILGESLMFQSWVLFFYLIVLATLSVAQSMTREETRLGLIFGDAYRTYKEKVPRFFPKTEAGIRFIAVLLFAAVVTLSFEFFYFSPVIGGVKGVGHLITHLIVGAWTTATCAFLFLRRTRRSIAKAFHKDVGASLAFLGLLLWGLSHLLIESVDAYFGWTRADYIPHSTIALMVNSSGWMVVTTIGLIIWGVQSLRRYRSV